MDTRVLFLDDSGKPEASHVSQAVVIAGFSVDSERYPDLTRRIQGAKRAFFPSLGLPYRWEIKSTELIKPNPWKRKKNRDFINELVRIVRSVGGTCCGATIVKAHMKHAMTLATSTPLQLQALVEHFDVECKTLGRMGMVVADWSSHQHDQHASRCVSSFVNTNHLNIHPCVYYASSHGNEAIQVADVLAGIRRRAAEGDGNLQAVAHNLEAIRACAPALATVRGRTYENCFRMF